MNSDPLIEWNRLNNENAKQDLISVMYGNLICRTTQLDLFSTWLLAATGAAATLVVTNIQSLASLLGKYGFKRALGCLVLSALLGLIAKFIFVFFQYGGDFQTKLFDQIKPILEKHGEEEKQILEMAKIQKLSLDSNIKMDQVIKEFIQPFPSIPRWLVLKYISKHKENRQIAFLLPLRAFFWQTSFTLLQALVFLAFILVAIRYAQVA